MSTPCLQAKLDQYWRLQSALSVAVEALLLAQKQNNDNIKAIMQIIIAGGECDVQPVKLDIALAPAQVLTNSPLETDISECLKVVSPETLVQLESQTTLVGEEISLDVDEMCVEEVCPEWYMVKEGYVYSLYSDSAVIGSEVAWWMTQDALIDCSGCAVEFVESMSQREREADPRPAVAPNARSLSSGSSTKTRRRRVYRPPAKGISPRLTQDEVNAISLQRRKK
ncbi:hypothetical protein HDU78_004618 [Chytriomyces hyalinus]|nr:hypothetical protein HDU78_004618 [Chytriomyces hyalinus]